MNLYSVFIIITTSLLSCQSMALSMVGDSNKSANISTRRLASKRVSDVRLLDEIVYIYAMFNITTLYTYDVKRKPELQAFKKLPREMLMNKIHLWGKNKVIFEAWNSYNKKPDAIFDTLSMTWSYKRISVNNGFVANMGENNTLVVGGGSGLRNDHRYHTDVYQYSSVVDEPIRLQSMNHITNDMAYGVVRHPVSNQERLVVAGGFVGFENTTIDTCQYYALEENEWQGCKPLERPMLFKSSIVWHNYLVAFGVTFVPFFRWFNFHLKVYDVFKNSWSSIRLPDMKIQDKSYHHHIRVNLFENPLKQLCMNIKVNRIRNTLPQRVYCRSSLDADDGWVTNIERIALDNQVKFIGTLPVKTFEFISGKVEPSSAVSRSN